MSESAARAKRRNPADPGLQAALDAAGTGSALAIACGVTESRVSQWQTIPWMHVLTIEAAFGVPRSTLRPDIYPPADEPGGGAEAA